MDNLFAELYRDGNTFTDTIEFCKISLRGLSSARYFSLVSTPDSDVEVLARSRLSTASFSKRVEWRDSERDQEKTEN